MNELQKAEFDILTLFVDICERCNLQYFLVCGSALGAVKYQGFIPWDDDIDVGMPRDDYEKFLEVAPSLLPRHIFIQNYKTDPQFPHVFSKLRNSNTTFIEKGMAHLDVNHGVYIDVFPLDGHPVSAWGKKVFEQKRKLLSWKQYCVFKGGSKKVKIRNAVFRFLGFHKRTHLTLAKMEKLYRKYSLAESLYWCNYGNYQGKLEYAAKEQYGNGVLVEFEGLNVRIPENFDVYLTQKFNNWRADLPKEQQVGHHYYEVFDLERPYTYYVKKNKDGIVVMKKGTNS